MKSSSNVEFYKNVSYNVESLFTSIPVQDMIDYILQRIYGFKEIKPFRSKSIFKKKLLLNLTKKCVFSVNNKLIKQVDGCPMRDTIPVAFSDIYVSKMDEDIVAPMKLHFCKRYVDDTCIRKKNNKNTCSY